MVMVFLIHVRWMGNNDLPVTTHIKLDFSIHSISHHRKLPDNLTTVHDLQYIALVLLIRLDSKTVGHDRCGVEAVATMDAREYPGTTVSALLSSKCSVLMLSMVQGISIEGVVG